MNWCTTAWFVPSPKAQVSDAAGRKASRQQSEPTPTAQPVHSSRTLPADLATLTRNTVRFCIAPPITVLATPTPGQRRAFALLGIDLPAA